MVTRYRRARAHALLDSLPRLVRRDLYALLYRCPLDKRAATNAYLTICGAQSRRSTRMRLRMSSAFM